MQRQTHHPSFKDFIIWVEGTWTRYVKQYSARIPFFSHFWNVLPQKRRALCEFQMVISRRQRKWENAPWPTAATLRLSVYGVKNASLIENSAKIAREKKTKNTASTRPFFCSCRVPKRKHRWGEPEPLQLGDPGPDRGVALGPGEHPRLRRGPLQRHPHGPRQGGRLRPLPHDLGSVAARSVSHWFIKIIAF